LTDIIFFYPVSTYLWIVIKLKKEPLKKPVRLMLACFILLPILVLASNGEKDELADNQKEEKIEVTPSEWNNYKGINVNIDDYGHSTFNLSFFGQMWVRHSWMNPGTVNSHGKPIDQAMDIGMRRMRIGATVNVEDKYKFYTQIGVNNQSFSSDTKPQIFFHDFWMSYAVHKTQFNIGGGLSLWSGISRLTNASSVSKLLLEYPNFAYPELGHTDQAGRQIGLFAYGNLYGLNYRLNISKPFDYQSPDFNNPVPNQAYEISNENLAFQGYLAYNFLDHEIPGISFMSMGYLGSKSIFNVGAGFYVHPNSVCHFDDAAQSEIHQARKHVGVDVFMDLPQRDGSVITMYTVAFRDDYGPNFLRTSSWMNAFSDMSTAEPDVLQGPGINEFVMGTGNIWYTSFGYMLPKQLNPDGHRLQPVLAATFKDFEALSTSSWQYDVGLNYYLHGHRFKLSAQYSDRPIYTGTSGEGGQAEVSDHKGLMIFQMQFFL